MSVFAQKPEKQSSNRTSSRLLPRLLSPEKLERHSNFRVLDFGRASALSVQFFSEYRCRIHVLESAASLLPWAANIDVEATTGELTEQLESLFPELVADAYDLILLWDTFNYLPGIALQPFCQLLNKVAAQHCSGHGFMLHKIAGPQQVRHCGIVDEGTIEISSQQDCELRLHTRKFVNQALSPLRIDHGILHGDGWLEFVFSNHGFSKTATVPGGP